MTVTEFGHKKTNLSVDASIILILLICFCIHSPFKISLNIFWKILKKKKKLNFIVSSSVGIPIISTIFILIWRILFRCQGFVFVYENNFISCKFFFVSFVVHVAVLFLFLVNHKISSVFCVSFCR